MSEPRLIPTGYGIDLHDGTTTAERARAYLCGGCNVREPWEHRCHKPQPCDCSECLGRACDCRECREARVVADRCPACGGLNPGDVTHTRCAS